VIKDNEERTVIRESSKVFFGSDLLLLGFWIGEREREREREGNSFALGSSNR
jgi:hypothetical protein